MGVKNSAAPLVSMLNTGTTDDGCKMNLTRTTYLLGMAAFVAVCTAGCSTEESLPQLDVDPDTGVDETRAGALVAEYVTPRSERAGGLGVHAQFLDVKGVNYDTALEALEVWSPDWQLHADACSLRSDPSLSEQRADTIRLELLDVGPITVRGPQEVFELEARRLPDLLSAFSGVIYGTEQSFGARNLDIDYAPGAQYEFDAPGRSSSAGFGVSLRAPEPVHIGSIGGLSTGHSGYIRWDFDRDAVVEWAPEVSGGADALFLDISSGFGPDRPRLSCRIEDDGSFVVPASILEQLATDSTELELSLRRINATSADIDGLETSEFIFSTVDQITLVGE